MFSAVLGRDALNPPYSSFVSSGAARATESDHHFSNVPQIRPRYRSPWKTAFARRSKNRWREASKAAGKGASVEDIRAVDADLVEQEARLLSTALGRVLDALPDGGRALVIGHSPTNEAAVLGLTGQVVGPMGKGEGVLITEDGGSYSVETL